MEKLGQNLLQKKQDIVFKQDEKGNIYFEVFIRGKTVRIYLKNRKKFPVITKKMADVFNKKVFLDMQTLINLNNQFQNEKLQNPRKFEKLFKKIEQDFEQQQVEQQQQKFIENQKQIDQVDKKIKDILEQKIQKQNDVKDIQVDYKRFLLPQFYEKRGAQKKNENDPLEKDPPKKNFIGEPADPVLKTLIWKKLEEQNIPKIGTKDKPKTFILNQDIVKEFQKFFQEKGADQVIKQQFFGPKENPANFLNVVTLQKAILPKKELEDFKDEIFTKYKDKLFQVYRAQKYAASRENKPAKKDDKQVFWGDIDLKDFKEIVDQMFSTQDLDAKKIIKDNNLKQQLKQKLIQKKVDFDQNDQIEEIADKLLKKTLFKNKKEILPERKFEPEMKIEPEIQQNQMANLPMMEERIEAPKELPKIIKKKEGFDAKDLSKVVREILQDDNNRKNKLLSLKNDVEVLPEQSKKKYIIDVQKNFVRDLNKTALFGAVLKKIRDDKQPEGLIKKAEKIVENNNVEQFFQDENLLDDFFPVDAIKIQEKADGIYKSALKYPKSQLESLTIQNINYQINLIKPQQFEIMFQIDKIKKPENINLNRKKNYVFVYLIDNHYSVGIINKQKREIVYFDSYGFENRDQKIIQNLKNLKKKISRKKFQLKINDINIQGKLEKQDTFKDIDENKVCGILNVLFLKQYFKNKPFREITEFDKFKDELKENVEITDFQFV